MLEALDTLKIPVECNLKDESTITVTRQGGSIDALTPDEMLELFLGNTSTAMWLLPAALCMGKGKCVLNGVPCMCK